MEVARTHILEASGVLWSRDALLQALPAQAEVDRQAERGAAPAGRTGKTSIVATMLLAEIASPAMDRSARFHDAIKAAVGIGMSCDELENLARRSRPRG